MVDPTHPDHRPEYSAGLAPTDDPQPAYPSLATQAGTAVKAAARFVTSGLATVDQAEFDRRRLICLGCPNFDAAADRCRKCGCSLAWKPWGKAEKCPIGEWEKAAVADLAAAR